MQLGHFGDSCPSTNVQYDTVHLAVLDCNGVHDVAVMFCACGEVSGMEATEVNQLLNVGWYPATKESPRTVATFSVLDKYEAIAFEGKLSGYHFYNSLVRLSDATECRPLPVIFALTDLS